MVMAELGNTEVKAVSLTQPEPDDHHAGIACPTMHVGYHDDTDMNLHTH